MVEKSQSKSIKYIPKQTLRIFTQVLLKPEVKANKTEAERVTGISRNLFNWNIRHHPEFRLWFEAQCDRALLGYRPKVDACLMQEIEAGNVPAMRTYYELIGVLKNKIEHSGSVQEGDTKVNAHPQVTYIFQSSKPTFKVDDDNPALYAGESPESD